MTDSTNDPLAPHHRHMLEAESGISHEVTEARGYRTITVKADLRRLGFSDYQSNVPALLVPVHGLGSEIETYQSRPDTPRIRSGKPLKYETPTGSKMAVDVPPPIRDEVLDVRVPLFITEGVKKADAAASKGICCIALLGVWNWRGTDEHGGKRVHPSFERIPLNGRPVYIVFDSDLLEKDSVRLALNRLGSVLAESYKADVRIVRLPSVDPTAGSTGSLKIGMDDFLVAGHTRDDLVRLAEPLDVFRNSDVEESIPYVATETGLIWNRPDRDGVTPVPLTNFIARIEADVAEDDGAETRRLFELAATRGPRSHHFTVPSERFATMNWVPEHLGAAAIIYPGMSLKDHARTAIQMLSGEIVDRQVFTHTGWRTVNGSTLFLTASGALGAEGLVECIEVNLPAALANYALPNPPTGETLQAGIRSSLLVLQILPLPVSAPSYAALWRSVLGAADFGVHVAGRTNAGKTAYGAVLLQHFGSGLNARNLPGSWSSTGNALEGLAFYAKDVLLLIDDFAPHGTTNDVARMNRDADRVFRAAGNNSARGRMRADGSLRVPRPPRGLILSTGEDVPRGQSLRSRLFALEIDQGSTNWNQLTICQQLGDDGIFAQAMAGFITWLAGRPSWNADLKELRVRLKDEVGLTTEIKRTITNTIELGAALRLFLQFTAEVGALTGEEEARQWSRCWRAIRDAAGLQHQQLVDSEPTLQFGQYLSAAISSGRAHLTDAYGSVPNDPEAWGWVSHGEDDWSPRGDRIGWINRGDIYLEPTASFGMAQQVGQREGESIALSKSQLWKRLAAKGLLASRDTKRQTLTIRKTVSGQSRSVLHIVPGLLNSLPGDPEPDKPDIEDEVLPGEDDDGRFDVGSSPVPDSKPDTEMPPDSGPKSRNVGNGRSKNTRETATQATPSAPQSEASSMPGSGAGIAENPTSKPTQPAFRMDEQCRACGRTARYSDGVCSICHHRPWDTPVEVTK